MGIALTLDYFGSYGHFNKIIPVHEHVMFFHLFVALISFINVL